MKKIGVRILNKDDKTVAIYLAPRRYNTVLNIEFMDMYKLGSNLKFFV